MAAQSVSSQSITPQQAVYVVDRLIKEGTISARYVAQLAAGMEAEIAELERRLAMLRSDDFSTRSSGRAGQRRRQRGPVRPEVAASRKLQGQYMGLMRHMKGRDRARIKKIAMEKGREAAVAEMRRMVG